MVFNFIGSLRVYGSLIIGVLLVFFNLPMFAVIVANRHHRRAYAVLASVILLSGLAGFASIATGIHRLIIMINDDASLMISNKDCLWNPSYFFRTLLNALNGVGLLLVSIDRLIVVAFPLFYFRHQLRIISLIMILPYTISTLYLIGAVLFTFIMPAYPVSILCGVETILYPSASIACLSLRAITASGSTMVMAAVVCIMKRRMQHIAKTHQTVAHGNISFFVRNQSRFTLTMIFSSIATIVLFVVPTCYQLVAQIFAFNHETIDSVAVYLNNMNSFNMVCVIVVKQHDIQMSLLGCFTCGKHFFEPANERNVVTVPERSHVEYPNSARSISFARRAELPEHVTS